MRAWFSGRTRACQARDSGSIPGARTDKKSPQGAFLCAGTVSHLRDLRWESNAGAMFG